MDKIWSKGLLDRGIGLAATLQRPRKSPRNIGINRPELVRYAFRTPPDRIVYDRFVPKYGEMQFLADQMVRFGLLEHGNIDGLIDDRFAKNADLSNITDLKSILKYPR